MILARRTVGLGLASWAIPFAAGFAAFPLKGSNEPLFQNVMGLVVLLTAGALLNVYFRGRAIGASEAVMVGLCWLAINLALDYPLFSYGPMRMSAGKYYSEIGLGYLAFPLFAWGAGRLGRARA